MKNQKENNLQEEIADTFARKINEIDKWQSKMNALELEKMPQQITDLDKAVTEVKEMKALDFSNQLAQLSSLLNSFDRKLDAIPKEIPLKNKIEFDTKAKFVIKLILLLGLTTMMLAGVVIALLIEMDNRTSDRNKYKIVKGFYPEIADQIDSAYTTNKDTLIKHAEMYIKHRELVLEAEAKANETREESKAAQKRLQHLKGGIDVTNGKNESWNK